jgi:hypothetical protein
MSTFSRTFSHDGISVFYELCVLFGQNPKERRGVGGGGEFCEKGVKVSERRRYVNKVLNSVGKWPQVKKGGKRG